MKEDHDPLISYLREGWGLPLGTARPVPPLPETTPPSEVVRSSLRCGDLRVMRALPLWLSLLPEVPPLPPDWSTEDRRRVAYLCDLARALACLRDEGRSSADESWGASVAGIRPRSWRRKVPLIDSPAPPVATSMFGERWGIEEPMTFHEYAAFQDQYLDVSGKGGRDAAGA